MEFLEGRRFFSAVIHADAGVFRDYLSMADVDADGALSVAELKSAARQIKTDIANLKAECKSDLNDLQSQYRSDLKDLNGGLREDLQDAEDGEERGWILSDYRDSLKDLNAQLKEDVADRNAELKEDLVDLTPSLTLMNTLAATINNKKNILDTNKDGKLGIAGESATELDSLLGRDGDQSSISSLDLKNAIKKGK